MSGKKEVMNLMMKMKGWKEERGRSLTEL